jgi:hypothetical protein
MTVTGTDDQGNFTDTGCATQPTQRPSTVTEYHAPGDIIVETGSHLTITQIAASHIAQRSATQRR